MKTTFKKLSTSLLAAAFGLVLVIGSSAFKAEKNGRVQYTFRYNDTNHSESNVEDESKWIYDASAPDCDGALEEACTIKVSAAFVNSGAIPTLKSTLNLNANPSSPSSAYVAGSADGSMEIENRSAE